MTASAAAPALSPRTVKRLGIALATVPALLAAAAFARHGLGPQPVTALIHRSGLWTIRLLLATLAVTPARALLGWKAAPVLRRPLGVATACYATAHLALYVAQQHGHLVFVATEIVRRVYLLIGFGALVGLLLLAVTSTDGAVRRLGRRWKPLHRLLFPLSILALLHFFMQSKIDVSSPVTYGGVLLWLMLWRIVPRRRADGVAVLAGLAVAAALVTAELEAGWYAAATRVPVARVLASELTIRFGPHPVLRVLLAGGVVLLLATIVRLARQGRTTRGAPRTLTQT